MDSTGTPASPTFNFGRPSYVNAPLESPLEQLSRAQTSPTGVSVKSDIRRRPNRPAIGRNDPYDSDSHSSAASDSPPRSRRASVQTGRQPIAQSSLAPGSGVGSTPLDSDYSNANSTASSSVPETVLASPLSTIFSMTSLKADAEEYETPSKRTSLVLDDAASEKSVYYTPRNSFYFNASGSRSSLNLDKIREMLETTEATEVIDQASDQESEREFPGAFPWTAEEGPELEHDFPGAFPYTPKEQIVPEASSNSHLEETLEVARPVEDSASLDVLPASPATNLADVPNMSAKCDSEDGSYETADGIEEREGKPISIDQPTEIPIIGSCETTETVPVMHAPSEQPTETAIIVSREPAESVHDMETPDAQFTELPTFQLQPPTPATITDVMQSPFREIDSPFEPSTGMPGTFIDDDVDLDNFAPDEIAYYHPDGAADGDDESGELRPSPIPTLVISPSGTPSTGDDTPNWYEPHEKTKPRVRATSMPARRQMSESGADTPPALPTKAKLDRGGRVRGAVVQVLNRPTTPGVSAVGERPSRTKAAAMIEDYNTTGLQRSKSNSSNTLQRSKSSKSVQSVKSTRSSRSGTISSQRTVVADKPERRARTPQPKPRESATPRPRSPEAPTAPRPEFRSDIQHSSSAYEPQPQRLTPPEPLRRSSSVYEAPRQGMLADEQTSMDETAHRGSLGSDMQQRGSATSSDLSSSSFRSGGVRGAGLGQGGWAAASAEPVKMYVPNDGNGWAAFHPLPPRSRATPLPGSRNNSFDLGGGRSSPSAGGSSVAPSASASIAESSQGPWVQSPQMVALHRSSMVSPTSSLSGQPTKSRLNVVQHFVDDASSDGGDLPSRSYASPTPEHPANVETPRPTFMPDEYRTVHINGKDYSERYDYASEHSSSHTSPAKNGNGQRWVPDAFFDRPERSFAPPRAPSSRSSIISAPSVYSQASTRVNSPLPPLPTDPSPYEAAARAHAARLGLASSLNPNVLTVLPEMSVHDSNQLYVPQRRDSRKFGSSASELGARGGTPPKRSASMFNVKRYSRAASDIGHNPREYASSEFVRPSLGQFDRRHSLDPRRASYDSRGDDAPSRSQSFRAPSRTGDYQPGEYHPAPSHVSERVSINLDTPDTTPLNNYPLMESNGYDESRGNGYT